MLQVRARDHKAGSGNAIALGAGASSKDGLHLHNSQRHQLVGRDERKGRHHQRYNITTVVSTWREVATRFELRVAVLRDESEVRRWLCVKFPTPMWVLPLPCGVVGRTRSSTFFV